VSARGPVRARVSKMRSTVGVMAAGAIVVALGAACGGGEPTPKSPSAEGPNGAAPVALPPVEKPALERFTTALDAFNAHDKERQN